jgi:hypothetical protein
VKFFFERYPLPIILLSLLFAVKALYFSFWVTPLWDIPDEVGHLAYVQDIAEGRGVPLLGQARIGEGIMRHLRQDENSSSVPNWIAQHPPVYYVIAAVPYKIGSYFTSDPEVLYRLPRIVSALSGALLLLVLFQTFLVIGLDAYRATAIAAAVGFIPMVSHMSSGTSHDVTLFLFCALATYYFARYLIQRNISDAYWCALWLTVAGGTKMTAWVLLVSMVAILLAEMPGPIKTWVKHAAGVSILALSVPLAWMTRNMLHFGDPFHLSNANKADLLAEPMNHSFVEFLHSQPVFEYFIRQFYGILGGIGTGRGRLTWFQVDGPPLRVFSLLIFFLGCVSVLYMFVLMYRAKRAAHIHLPGNSLLAWVGNRIRQSQYSGVLMVLGFVIALLVAGYIGMSSYTNPSLFGHARISAVTMWIFIAILALPLLLITDVPRDRIALYGMVLLILFGLAILSQVYASYLEEGRLRATQGRYFFPVVPVVLLSAAIALMRLRVPAVVIAIVAAFLALMEFETYVLQAIPYYLAGGV